VEREIETTDPVTITYGKLVRDRIPEIIRAAGHVPHVRTLPADQRWDALLAKLAEESAELGDATNTQELLTELADVLEVVMGLAAAAELAWSEVESTRDARRRERGGFDQGLWLETVDEFGG
jgi:predicted house-cleaning noncanonical NTP pyrophosphatase (MazG superfamily)